MQASKEESPLKRKSKTVMNVMNTSYLKKGQLPNINLPTAKDYLPWE